MRSLLMTSSLGPRPVAPVRVLLTRSGVKWQQWKGADSRSSCKCKCRVICGLNVTLGDGLLQLSAESTSGPSQAEMSSLGPLLRCWWHGPAGPVGAAARGGGKAGRGPSVRARRGHGDFRPPPPGCKVEDEIRRCA